jgi:antitoxin component YwqK of YwqJK toxin-antitoxin module
MNKSILSLAVLMGILVFASCEKAAFNPFNANPKGIAYEAALQEAMVVLPSSNYERIVEQALERPNEYGSYTKGIISYKESGELKASINFDNGDKDKATKITSAGETKLSLKKSGGDSDYEKVIVEPIVKTDDCECIVAGIIEFYKEGVLLATVDYGNGECDDIATKTTEEGTYEFDGVCGKKDYDKKDKEDYDFEKVITNPIVEADDCDCIVAGTVELYKEGALVATIDYGNGECDNMATKTTEEGTYEFEIDCDK